MSDYQICDGLRRCFACAEVHSNFGEKIVSELRLCAMNDEPFGANDERVTSGMSRRLFLRATLAGGAALLAGRAATLLSAASPSDTSTFSIGADLPFNRLAFGAMRLTRDGISGCPPAS